jgi:NitT/TauT family transport system ATP-binding protein
VVLPPPFMVESIANGHVDAFCVGAPWNSVAVDLGIAHILHFVSEILQRAAEKVLAVRSDWASKNPDVLMRLIRAHGGRRSSSRTIDNREEVCRILSAPNRIGVSAEVIRRTLDGRLKVAPDGTFRSSDRYLLVGRKGAARPDPVQAAWLYAQMVRWGQAPMSDALLKTSLAVFPPGSVRRGAGSLRAAIARRPADGVGAFVGPAFNANDIVAHLAPWSIRRSQS